MTSGIYCYIDLKNNEIVYIGKDSNIDKRKRHKDHLQKYRRNKQQINRVLQNNPTRYKYKVLEKGNISRKILNVLEMVFIRKYNPKFNFTEGGEGTTGWRHSCETKKKISEANKGKKLSKQHRKKLSDAHKNKTLSPQHRQKISESHKGYKHSQKTKIKISNSNKGKTLNRKKTIDEKIIISKTMSSCGFFRVTKNKDKTVTQNFIWMYQYYDNKVKKRKKIRRVSLIKLREVVLKKKLEWKIINEEKAKQTCKKYNYNYEDLK